MVPYLKLTLLVGVLLLHTSSASVLQYVFGAEPMPNSRPAFCKEYQCPNFTVIEHNDNYEVRRYEPTTWVATESEGGWFINWKMFTRLAKYTLLGHNNRDLKMSMTVPVLTKYRDSTLEEMLFMLPEEFQANPPLPTDASVTIVKMPAMEVYVKSFGGYAMGSQFESEVEALKSALSSSETYEEDVMYRVGYDSPMTFFNRHNEVWLVKQ